MPRFATKERFGRNSNTLDQHDLSLYLKGSVSILALIQTLLKLKVNNLQIWCKLNQRNNAMIILLTIALQ